MTPSHTRVTLNPVRTRGKEVKDNGSRWSHPLPSLPLQGILKTRVHRVMGGGSRRPDDRRGDSPEAQLIYSRCLRSESEAERYKLQLVVRESGLTRHSSLRVTWLVLHPVPPVVPRPVKYQDWTVRGETLDSQRLGRCGQVGHNRPRGASESGGPTVLKSALADQIGGRMSQPPVCRSGGGLIRHSSLRAAWLTLCPTSPLDPSPAQSQDWYDHTEVRDS